MVLATVLMPHAPCLAAQQIEAPGANRARALPRSIQVFSVPVPAVFLTGQPVTYAITPTGGATIVPPLQGVAAAGGISPGAILVAASVPAAALAGVRTVAQVQFSQGRVSVTVPLELEVSQIAGATLRLVQQLFGAKPGERVVIHYFVTNSGNGLDTVDITVVPPPDWRTIEPPRRYVLGAGQTTSGDATISVPPRRGR